MTADNEYNRCGEELEELLGLKTSPLAVKMLEKEADIPPEAIRPKKDRSYHLAQCQAFSLSRKDKETISMNDLRDERRKILMYLYQIAYPDGGGGFIIKNFPTQNERAKKSVNKRVGEAKKNIEKHHPEAYEHFHEHITCGATCKYTPKTQITWVL